MEFNVISWFSVLLSWFLAFFILIKPKKKIINYIFSVTSFSFGLTIFGIVMTGVLANNSYSLLMNRLAVSGAVLSAASMLNMAAYFPTNPLRISYRYLSLISAPAILVALISPLASVFVKSLRFENGSLQREIGVLYIPYVNFGSITEYTHFIYYLYI